MKTLLVLGGTPYQIPAIRYAQSQGHRVFTCDYLPDNPGHKLADAYFNISTTDRHAVLELARQEQVDGILAYASDPAAPTAAFVAEQLGLPGNPLSAVETLTQKDLFRSALQAGGFHYPRFASARTLMEARKMLQGMSLPAIIKPVDSSGSKGVSQLQSLADLEAGFQRALKFSRCRRVIIEEWIERSGYQIAGDGFVVDGQLVFHCLAQEHFSFHGLVPVGESFPLQLEPDVLATVVTEVQRLLTQVGFVSGELNFDIMLDHQDRVYLIEIGPRSGGNLIPEAIRQATGVDLTARAVDSALGLDCSSLRQQACTTNVATIVVHAPVAGIFQQLRVSSELDVIAQHLFVQPGAYVEPLSGSHCTLGILLVRFASHAQMLYTLDHLEEFYELAVLPAPCSTGVAS